MSDLAEEIKSQIDAVKQQVENGEISATDAQELLTELQSTFDALDNVTKEIAIKYISIALGAISK